MYLVLKDLFYQDQFINSPTRLDRDRYFIALAILSWLPVLFSVRGQFLNDGMAFEGSVANHAGLLWVGFTNNISLDPLLMLAHLWLANRMFGRLLALPLGLLNYQVATGLNLLVLLSRDFSAPPSEMFWAQGGIALVWLILHAFVFGLKPSLSQLQPKHPLLGRNRQFAQDKQLTAVQYFWRAVLLAITNIAFALTLVVAIVIFGGGNGSDVLNLLSLLWSLFVFALAMLFWVRRLRNMGWRPLVWFAWLLLSGVFFGLHQFLNIKGYFGQMWLYVSMHMVQALLILWLAGVTVCILALPAPGFGRLRNEKGNPKLSESPA